MLAHSKIKNFINISFFTIWSYIVCRYSLYKYVVSCAIQGAKFTVLYLGHLFGSYMLFRGGFWLFEKICHLGSFSEVDEHRWGSQFMCQVIPLGCVCVTQVGLDLFSCQVLINVCGLPDVLGGPLRFQLLCCLSVQYNWLLGAQTW